MGDKTFSGGPQLPHPWRFLPRKIAVKLFPQTRSGWRKPSVGEIVGDKAILPENMKKIQRFTGSYWRPVGDSNPC